MTDPQKRLHAIVLQARTEFLLDGDEMLRLGIALAVRVENPAGFVDSYNSGQLADAFRDIELYFGDLHGRCNRIIRQAREAASDPLWLE